MTQHGKPQNISISMAGAPSEFKATDIQSTSKAHYKCWPPAWYISLWKDI